MRQLAIILLFTSSIALAALTPEDIETIRSELREPVTLRLENGQSILGFPTQVSDNQIQIKAADGAGEIIYTFQQEEIRSIEVPGESYKSLALEWSRSGQNEDALALMDLLYAQRSLLIPILPPSESNFFIIYAQLILDSPKPARAIAVTERLKPQIQNPSAILALEDTILESYYTLELYQTATELAVTWVAERNPYGASALGYYVLGISKLREENYEEALNLALRPIAFSTPIKTEKLAECYALAISASLGLRDTDYATALFAEMQERGFNWPDEEKLLDPFHEKLIKQLNKDASKTN